MASQAPGPPEPAPPEPAPPAARLSVGPLTLRLAVLVVAAAATALGAWLGAWWVPFLVGLAAGALGRARARARARARNRAPAGNTARTGDTAQTGDTARTGDTAPTGHTARTRRPGGVLPAVAGAILGWAIPLWALALDGQPVGATARTIAGLAGLPPHAGVTVTVVLLLAALQVLAGAWLARGVLPKRPLAQEREQPEAGTADVNIGQA